MHRCILTGYLIFALCAGGSTLASASESSRLISPNTPVSAAQDARASITAAPTAGADLAMWSASSETSVAIADDARHASRLRRFARRIMTRSSAIASSLTRSAMRFLGTPYVFGGSEPGGFDCSGYVQHVFAMIGRRLPRTADAQFDAGTHLRTAMAPGDLVFFHTYEAGPSHVGIYLGHDKFIHSSSSRGVSISSLHSSYWAQRYLGAKRVVGS